MTVTTPAPARSTTADPTSAGASLPFTTANQASTPTSQPSKGADRTGWFGAMTKKNAI